MRLPVIKHIYQFIEENDVDFVSETIQVLEHMSEGKDVKDEELDVLGELISNLYGAVEVRDMIASGMSKKDALNKFMERVVGSIDK